MSVHVCIHTQKHTHANAILPNMYLTLTYYIPYKVSVVEIDEVLGHWCREGIRKPIRLAAESPKLWQHKSIENNQNSAVQISLH